MITACGGQQQNTQEQQGFGKADDDIGLPVIAEADIAKTLTTAGLENICTTRPDARGMIIENHNRYRAYPLALCDGDTHLGHAIYWLQTFWLESNTIGSRSEASITSPAGTQYPAVEPAQYNAAIDSITSTFVFEKSGKTYECSVVKPADGVAPMIYTACNAWWYVSPPPPYK